MNKLKLMIDNKREQNTESSILEFIVTSIVTEFINNDLLMNILSEVIILVDPSVGSHGNARNSGHCG